MEIKFGSILILFLVMMPIQLFPNEHDAVELQKNIFYGPAFTDTWPPNLLIQDNNSLNMFSFQFLDGAPVSRREAIVLISTVPNNHELMRQIRRGTIASLITTGLSIAMSMTALIYIAADLPGASEIAPSLFGVSLVATGISWAFIETPRNQRLLRAVDNYNLYILDIP